LGCLPTLLPVRVGLCAGKRGPGRKSAAAATVSLQRRASHTGYAWGELTEDLNAAGRGDWAQRLGLGDVHAPRPTGAKTVLAQAPSDAPMPTVTQTFDPTVGPVIDAYLNGVPVRLVIATGSDRNILREEQFDRLAEGHDIAVVDVALLTAFDPPITLRAVEFTRNEWPPRYTWNVDGVIGSSAMKEPTFTFDGPRRQFRVSTE
jgi:hypothetical protein